MVPLCDIEADIHECMQPCAGYMACLGQESDCTNVCGGPTGRGGRWRGIEEKSIVSEAPVLQSPHLSSRGIGTYCKGCCEAYRNHYM